MSFDLSKLTPAPWIVTVVDQAGQRFIKRPSGHLLLMAEFDDNSEDVAALDFAALARNAFDVMMRRGWGVVKGVDGWFPALPITGELYALRKMRWPDPFTALVEADAWWEKNI